MAQCGDPPASHRARWIDEAPAPSDGEFAPAADNAADRLYITNSIDRVVAIYRRYSADPTFWDDSSRQVLRRVSAP